METVLCVGGESVASRRAVLTSHGFKAVVATTERAALAMCQADTVKVAILDTRSPITALPGLAAELKLLRPEMQVLLVSDAGLQDAPEPRAQFDRVISRLDGPTVLLESVYELLLKVGSTTNAAASETVRKPASPSLNLIMQRTRSLSETALKETLRARDLRETSKDLRADNYDYREFLSEQRLSALAKLHAWMDKRAAAGPEDV